MTRLLEKWRDDAAIREAAWVARCVGDAESSPLTERDIAALASYLEAGGFAPGEPVFHAGARAKAVCIVRAGMIELSVGAGARKVVVQMLHPGSVDGDIQLILDMPLAYSGRAVDDARCLFLDAPSFERLLREHPALARRWVSSVAARLSRAQARLIGMLGRPLIEQTARLLLDEQQAGRVPLPQRTLAAMLGVRRPSLNKVLRDLQGRGLIDLGYAEITIRDLDGLERLAPERR